MSVLSGIKDVLNRVVINPVALILFLVWLLFTIAEYYGKRHPIDYLIYELSYIEKTKGIDLSIPLSLLNHIRDNKHIATFVSLNLLTVLVRSDIYCMIFETIYSAYIIVHPALDFYYHMCCAVVLFLYFYL